MGTWIRVQVTKLESVPVMRCQCDPIPGSKLVSCSEFLQRAYGLLANKLVGVDFTYDREYCVYPGCTYKGRSLRQCGIDIDISDYDLLLDIDTLSMRYIDPAMAMISNQLREVGRPIIFHEMEVPCGLIWSKSIDKDFSLRLVRAYDIRTDTKFTRFDLMYSLADEAPIENTGKDAYFNGLERDEWLRNHKRMELINNYESPSITKAARPTSVESCR